MKKNLFLCLLLFSNSSFSSYQFETVLDNLDDAWSFVFLSEDKILYTEMPGKLKIASLSDKSIKNIDNVPSVQYSGQGGLSEVALDPEFESNQKIYFSYSSEDKNGKSTLFLSSAELRNNALVNSRVIFKANAPRRSPVHLGAKIAFLKDGTLLLASGDGFDHREQAQTLDNHFGKIIRINKDGSIPKDNPFINLGNVLPEIYSYGHRNMQGLVVTRSGKVYEHEHGPKGGDEMNLVEPSLNYGWPAITYGIDYSGAVISPFTEKDGMEQPLLHWTPSIAPSDMIFYEGNVYPELKDSFLVTALVSKDVKKVTFKNGIDSQETLFSELDIRLRNIQASPGGIIYLLTDGPNGKLIKVLPKEL
ncbi:PQQ-dependent sugar dehydrogenase [Gammaproteobacteria bacterium]|nr:PQQ-dependent sugar dehydrogenase [Gammaproteobacteria bacterium]